MKSSVLTILLLTALTAPAMAGEMAMDGMAMGHAAHEKSTATQAVGVVKAVDQSHGMVTISHEPIKSLGWSAMTMDFVVNKPEFFKKLNPGKKIRFQFIEQGENYLVTAVD